MIFELNAVRSQVRDFASKFIKNEKGVTAIEYAIVAAGVGGIVIVIFKSSAGGPVFDMLTDVFDKLKDKITGLLDTTP